MSWPLVKLTEVAEINPRCPKDIDEDQIVSFVAMASASEAGLLLGEELKVLKDTKKGFTYFERGDVLLAKITPCFENGKSLRPYQIKNQVGFGSTEFHVVRADLEKLDPTYLFYLLWSDAFRFLGTNAMAGAAGQKRVGTPFLKQLEIPLPPLEEQKRIAAILDKADAIHQKRKQAIDLADEFLRSVFLDMFGDPVTNPKGFPVKVLSQLYIDPKNGTKCGPFGSALKKEEFVDEGIPVWNMDNISLSGNFKDEPKLWVTEEKFNEIDAYSVIDGDVIISRAGTVGKMGVVRTKYSRSLISTNLIRVRFSEDLLPEFFVALMTYCKGRVGRLKTGPDGSFTHMNTGILDKLEFPYPPVELQRKFLKLLADTEKYLDKMPPSQLNDLFNSLSQKAFSGQL
ncbi:restriction endonuclease subunit S [Vibrio vulnificus]|nr:restriction endonuclease subunit S [Vibrio vulnificus]